MYLKAVVVIVVLAIATVSRAAHRKTHRKNEYGDKTLWKKEYEEELRDAMFSHMMKDNITRVPQSAASQSDGDNFIERLVESLSSSEKYLKKVDSIDFRLNRLDIEVHEKTNNILKHLTDIMKVLNAHHMDKAASGVLNSLKNEVYQIKYMLESTPRAVEGTDFHHAEGAGDPALLDNRLGSLDAQVKHIMSGVETIVTTIKEVKARQYSKNYKSDEMASSTGADTMSLINEFRRAMLEQKSKRCELTRSMGRVDRSERYPTDCREIQLQGFNVSGIYKIKPDDMEPFYVLCDLTTAGGGWTVIQNRYDGSQDFYKGWADYKNGFGNLAGEFWLGLEKMYYLTNQKLYELRVEMETQHGSEAFAGYSVFTVGPEYEGFRISTLGTYYGSAGDSLSYHAGQKFSTFDTDNDEWKDGACAAEHGGAWWYKECDKSNLNGKYATPNDESRGQSIYWISFKGPNYPLAKTKMMIRPLPASKPSAVDQSRTITEQLVKRPPTLRNNKLKISGPPAHAHYPAYP